MNVKLLVVLLGVVLLGCCLQQPPVETTTTSTFQSPGEPSSGRASFAGAMIAFKYLEDLTSEYNLTVDGYFNKMRDAGVTCLRFVDLPASEQGRLYAKKLGEMGFEMMPTLSISSTKFDEEIEDAAEKEKWGKVKTLIVEEYYEKELIPKVEMHKDYVKYWQVWNEENGGEKFGLNKVVYSLLLTGKAKTASGEVIALTGTVKGYSIENGSYGLIKQICPDCKVVLGGLAGSASNPEYLQYLHDNDALNYADVIDFHANFNPERDEREKVGGYFQYWNKLSSGVVNVNHYLCGGECSKPIWVTEIGSTSNFKYIEVDKKGSLTGYSMTASMDFQADDVVKRYISMLSLGIEKGFWNQFFDYPGEKHKKGEVLECPAQMEDGFYTSSDVGCKGLYKGLVWNNLEEKPSFKSYKLLTQKLAGVQEVERIATKSNTFLFKAVFSNGSVKFVAWCEPFFSEDFSQKKYWNYEDKDCSEKIGLTPYGLSGNVTVSSRSGVSHMHASSISLTKSPVYIEQSD